jgi:AraC-like DNA-binding protein
VTIGAQRPPDSVRAWKPSVPGVSEVFHARFADYAYPPHVHDTWTLFIVDAGEIRYDLDRHHRGAWHSAVSVLPPQVVHDGRPADDRGYRKRVLYLDTSVLGEDLIGRAVDRSALEDPPLRRAVERLHPLLERPDDALEAESVTALVADRLRLHLLRRPAEGAARGGPLAHELRELLEAQLFERLTLASFAQRLAASPAHLVRSFSRAFGLPPHAYVLGRRIDAARSRLLAGQDVAAVAAEVGFYDQAHLTRHFKRHVGTTPARYARAPLE